jgi:hypothetical protein
MVYPLQQKASMPLCPRQLRGSTASLTQFWGHEARHDSLSLISQAISVAHLHCEKAGGTNVTVPLQQ